MSIKKALSIADNAFLYMIGMYLIYLKRKF
jgi:hypothetical protein